MTDTDANPELTARVKALSFTTCGLVAAAEQFATIALQVAGALDGLHTDLQGLPPEPARRQPRTRVLPHRRRHGSTTRHH